MTKYLTTVALAISLNCFGQKQVVPTPQSPTAAAVGKYGDTDVSLYTGQINPNINLFDIKFNDYSFPIGISYASSGLKVQETPSSVGMGWSLSGMGVINRQIRGVPDEQTHGYNGEYPTANYVQGYNSSNYVPYLGVTKEKFETGIGELDYDGEPDLFNFSMPGYGGKFFFDETQILNSTKTAIFIPNQALSAKGTFTNDGTQLLIL